MQRGDAACTIATAPTPELQEDMVHRCAEEWMEKMQQRTECVGYFSAGTASPACSAADLDAVCQQVAQSFTLQDARRLCGLLGQAHESFWPSFWAGSN